MGVPPTAEALIRCMTLAKAGDKAAFADVYTSLFVPVYRYILRRVGNRSDAEDLTQQVFLRLYNSRTEFSNQNLSPLNYLYTVARHCLADFFKAQNRAPLNFSEDTDAPDTVSMESKAMSQIAAEQLLQLVSEEEKNILTLRLIEGFTSREVAIKINKSEAAVRQIQCRALQKIREKIK